jgi:DNA repair protein SbcC/Rad50
MIPLSVRMKGWMRYRDEQVADFSGARLIAICGENGAGKSSIFDAITFALYGQHRLGKQKTVELISQDMDRCSVDFEFEADGRRYSVHRSRGRKANERQQSLWTRDSDDEDWVQVPGSDKEEGLDRALAQIIRLSADAFTSSFMLQQGAATEFLDADPKGRFDIVSSLIGLREYQALEAASRAAGREEKRRLGELTEKLKEYDGVDEAALERARTDAAASDAREAEAASALQSARQRLADAQRHERLSAEIAALDARIAGAEALIAQRGQVEKDAATYDELSRAVEALGRVEATLADADRSSSAADEAARQAATMDVDALARSHVDAERAMRGAAAAVKAAEKAHAAALAAERTARDFAALATVVIEGRERIAGYDAQIVEYDARIARLAEAEGEAARLRAIAGALPLLSVLKDARERLDALGADDPAAALKALAAERKAAERAARDADAEFTAADAALAAARQCEAECQALVATLEAQLRECEEAVGETTCSRCGQPVDAKRAKAEITELRTRLKTARADVTAVAKETKAAATALDAGRKRAKACADELARIEREVNAAEARRDEHARAAADVKERHAAFVAAAPAELASALPADAPAAVFTAVFSEHGDAPTRAAAATKELEQLRAVEGQRSVAIAEREKTAAAVAAEEAKLDGRRGDLPSARAEHDAAVASLDAAERAVSDGREAADAARGAEETARRALSDGREQRARRESEAAQRRQEAQGHRQAAEAFATQLGGLAGQALEDPAGTLATVRAHQQSLADAPKRKEALERALSDYAEWTGQRSAKTDEIAGIPEAHRVAEADAADAVRAAEAAAGAARVARDALRHQVAVLEEKLGQVAGLVAERDEAARRHTRFNKLTRLLGKNGLQGALIATALGAIANHANAFLRRLTGGSLQLTIDRADGDALELRAIDSTCMRDPRNVRALSGSQKFRCAVAIAAGIGQYAGAGGMRSIVIDEGFGSLDREGQRQMVDELKNLATHMEKVIVVSHLDVFTDRDNFPDQLLVETDGSASRIRRVF